MAVRNITKSNIRSTALVDLFLATIGWGLEKGLNSPGATATGCQVELELKSAPQFQHVRSSSGVLSSAEQFGQ